MLFIYIKIFFSLLSSSYEILPKTFLSPDALDCNLLCIRHSFKQNLNSILAILIFKNCITD